MKLVTYNYSYKQQLSLLLLDYFNELHGDEVVGDVTTAGNMIKELINSNHSIYLLLDDNQESSHNDIIGFIIVYINDQYGMTKPIIVNEYMYIEPNYRSGRAILYLYTMLGIICDDYQCDGVGTTYSISSNINNNKKLGGIPIATTYRFPLKRVQQITKRYKDKIWLK